jgi:hypothetical protein
MGRYHELKEMLCDELDKIVAKGDINGSALEIVHKLTDTIKNIDKIEMLEDGDYSQMDEYSHRRGYSRDGDWEARGSYGNDGSGYNEGGNSYRKRDSMGRYSRDDGKDHMIHRLREMMNSAGSEREREALRHCISKLENA